MNTRNNPLHLWVHAREMALMGYVTRIIILETGLTDKQVRRIYRDLEDDGMDVSKNRASNAIKSGASLVTNQLSKLHASLLMGFYGVRLENGKYPTLSLFFVQTAVH